MSCGRPGVKQIVQGVYIFMWEKQMQNMWKIVGFWNRVVIFLVLGWGIRPGAAVAAGASLKFQGPGLQRSWNVAQPPVARIPSAPGLTAQDTLEGWLSENIVVPSDVYTDIQPDFRIDRQGEPWVIWQRGSRFGGVRSLYWTRWNGNQWSDFEQILPNDQSDAVRPRFVFDENSTLWLVWNRIDDSSIWFVRGYDGVWPGAQSVHAPDTLTYYAPSIDIGGGEAWVAWYGQAGADPYDVYATHFSNGQWETPTNITAGVGGYNWFCDIAVDPTGAPHVVWADGYTFRVLYSTKSLGGAWTTPVALNDVSKILASSLPRLQIVASSDGSLHVVWAGFANNGGVLGDSDIYYACKDSLGWSNPIVVSQDSGQLDTAPEIRVRGARDMWIAWESHQGSLSDSGKVVVSHFDGVAATLPQRLDSGNFTWGEFPRMDLDTTGRPWIVWGAIQGDFSDDAIFYSRYVGPDTPVLLSDLKVLPLRDGAELRWQADSEAFVLFRVERSDGGAFLDAGRVAVGPQSSYAWQERGLVSGTYAYRIAGVRRDGEPLYLGPVSVEVGAPPRRLILEVLRIAQSGVPAELSLGIPEGGELRLQVLDLQGRLVGNVDLGQYPPGWHTLSWSPRSGAGQDLASGVYFLRAAVGSQVATGRVLVLR